MRKFKNVAQLCLGLSLAFNACTSENGKIPDPGVAKLSEEDLHIRRQFHEQSQAVLESIISRIHCGEGMSIVRTSETSPHINQHREHVSQITSTHGFLLAVSPKDKVFRCPPILNWIAQNTEPWSVNSEEGVTGTCEFMQAISDGTNLENSRWDFAMHIDCRRDNAPYEVNDLAYDWREYVDPPN